MALTDEEFGLLQASVDAMMDRLGQLRLGLVVERDFDKLVRFLRAMSAKVNPTYDPATSDLSRDSFWLRVVDENGDTVASHAQRVFTTPDFLDLVENGTVWYAKGFHFDHVERPPVHIGGTVAHAGALWVAPVFRKQGLSMFLPFLSRALCLRNYDCDYITAIVLKRLAESVLPTMAYGYPHCLPCARGWFPPEARVEDIYLCWMSQGEMVERFRRLPEHPQYPLQIYSEMLRQAVA